MAALRPGLTIPVVGATALERVVFVGNRVVGGAVTGKFTVPDGWEIMANFVLGGGGYQSPRSVNRGPGSGSGGLSWTILSVQAGQEFPFTAAGSEGTSICGSLSASGGNASGATSAAGVGSGGLFNLNGYAGQSGASGMSGVAGPCTPPGRNANGAYSGGYPGEWGGSYNDANMVTPTYPVYPPLPRLGAGGEEGTNGWPGCVLFERWM